MTDPLTPVYVRLRRSTVAALREAQARSSHRSLAAYVESIVRAHLAQNVRVDRLTDAAGRLK